MAFELAPDPGDRGEPDVKLGRTGGAAVGEDRRLVRDGVQVLARGAMLCPECALPIAPPERIRPKAELECGFCAHRAPAHAFVRDDVVDTRANAVVVVARVA
ncbi:MAG TPA: hypothetical protein VHJ54_02515 [Solirubrobacterales bacterium]|jgi:hypothetical protein|nr:hypothetical protein [Solirubrobacterales bacterium]